MTQQPVEPQQVLKIVWSQHNGLLLQMSRPEEADLEQVQTFLKTLAQAGASIDAAEDRSTLQELIRYWSSFIDRKTGEFPIIQLQPFDTSRKQISSARDQEFLTSAVNENNSFSQQSSSLPEQQQAPPFPNQIPGIWNVPYPRNPLFTGRDDLLTSLYTQLQAGQTTALSQPQAISGLGGIGKTQTAVEYAYRYYQDYQAIFWVRADTHDALVSGYVTLAMLLRLPEKDERDQTIVVQAVKRWLQTHRNWLLILDNADDLSLLHAFLPSVSGGHILLTTRAQAMGRLARQIEVETMPQEVGALFLLRRASLIAPDAPLEQATPSDAAIAREICLELGGLPLALDQAGAYIEETRCSLSDYWSLYHTRRTEVLKRRGGLVDDHPEPVATTWSLSFEQVAQKNPAAADLLRFCAFLHPDAIPVEILTTGAGHLGPVLQPVASDPLSLDGAIAALGAYSLISRDAMKKTLIIHRLVQAVLQDGMSEEIRMLWVVRVIHAVNLAFPDVEYETWPQCDRLLPHALLCAELIQVHQLTLSEAARLLDQTGDYLQERARYQEAEPLFLHALSIRERLLGVEHPDTATTLNNLAVLYRSQGKYAEAEPLFLRALQIRERHLGADHPSTALSLNNLAHLYYAQGKYGKAEPLYRRALSIQEQQLGTDHPDTALSLNNLAYLYYAQGKYSEAEPLFLRALQIQEQQLGTDHPDTALSLNNLAELYYTQGKYSEAEPLFLRALQIQEQQLGPEHPYTASSLNNLAALYRRQGKYSEAEPLFLRALQIQEQQLGPEHPYTASSLDNLALLYQSQGKYFEAESLARRALSIYEQKLGAQHPHTQLTRRNYVSLLRKLGRDEEANALEAPPPPPS